MALSASAQSLPLRESAEPFTVTVAKVDKALVGEIPKLTRQERDVVDTLSKTLTEDLEVAPISGTRLTFYSHEDILKTAVCECTLQELEGDGSPNDSRLGTLEDDRLCGTCNRTSIQCTGHCGYIDLNRWFLHPKRAELAIYVLTCVCNSCGRILTDETTLQLMGIMDYGIEARIKAIAETTAGIRCSNTVIDSFGIHRRCIPNPTYFPTKAKDGYVISCEYSDPRTKGAVISTERTIEEAFLILSNIDAESLRIMGFTGKNHPKNFVMRSLLVIPPCARPYVVGDDGLKRYDNITTSYCDIIRQNNLIGKHTHDFGEKTEMEKRDAVRNLYFFIYHLIDNTDGRYTRSRDEPVQSILQRIGGDKDSLVRGANMGKRVDFCGRTVLGANNRVEFGEIAYPECMREAHTLPIKVADFNIEALRKKYADGEIVNIIFGSGKLKGKLFKINERNRSKFTINVGDTVEIAGKDGDETMFNRQPTLDKCSMMGYKAKYMKAPTIGLHSSYTTPHNADFDGDEGNKHKIQTLDARAEIRYFAGVGSCIMNGKKSCPTMGLVYNCATSAYLMTYKNRDIHPKYWEDACTRLKDRSHLASLPTRLAKYGKNMYTSMALFSVLLPEDFAYKHAGLEIVNGIIIKGAVNAKHIGPKMHSMIQTFWKFYGKGRTERFFTEAQWILDWYLEFAGFGINFLDCFPENLESIHEIVMIEFNKVQTEVAILGNPTETMTQIEREHHERSVINHLSAISRIGGTISKETLTSDNALNIMGDNGSGAKGKDSNIAQILGCLGQQYVKGKRPEKTYTEATRCLPYFEPRSTDVRAHGFVPESFFQGSRPSGFYYHLMASRVGLMDTALTTADSGHLQHRMMKTMEDFTVGYDGSIRTANGGIMSCSYSDGYAGSELVKVSSDSDGQFFNFIDVKMLATRLNNKVEATFTSH